MLLSLCKSYNEALGENMMSCPKDLTQYVDARSHHSEQMFCSHRCNVRGSERYVFLVIASDCTGSINCMPYRRNLLQEDFHAELAGKITEPIPCDVLLDQLISQALGKICWNTYHPQVDRTRPLGKVRTFIPSPTCFNLTFLEPGRGH